MIEKATTEKRLVAVDCTNGKTYIGSLVESDINHDGLTLLETVVVGTRTHEDDSDLSGRYRWLYNANYKRISKVLLLNQGIVACLDLDVEEK